MEATMFEATLLEATLYGGYYVRGYFVPGPLNIIQSGYKFKHSFLMIFAPGLFFHFSFIFVIPGELTH